MLDSWKQLPENGALLRDWGKIEVLQDNRGGTPGVNPRPGTKERVVWWHRLIVSLTLLVGAKLVGFADDIRLVYGKAVEGVELIAAYSIIIMKHWMRSRQLELARHNTKLVMENNGKSEQEAGIWSLQALAVADDADDRCHGDWSQNFTTLERNEWPLGFSRQKLKKKNRLQLRCIPWERFFFFASFALFTTALGIKSCREWKEEQAVAHVVSA